MQSPETGVVVMNPRLFFFLFSIAAYFNTFSAYSRELTKVHNITFQPYSYSLDAKSRKTLDSLLKTKTVNNNQFMMVYGYANFFGDRDECDFIASERAKAVAKYLLSHGIQDNNILLYTGLGLIDSEAQAMNQNGAANYMRVEILTQDIHKVPNKTTVARKCLVEKGRSIAESSGNNANIEKTAFYVSLDPKTLSVKLPGGDVFFGTLNSKDQREEFGVYIWESGEKYTGDFHNNLRNGHGVYKWATGETFEGEWRNDEPVAGILTEDITKKYLLGILADKNCSLFINGKQKPDMKRGIKSENYLTPGTYKLTLISSEPPADTFETYYIVKSSGKHDLLTVSMADGDKPALIKDYKQLGKNNPVANEQQQRIKNGLASKQANTRKNSRPEQKAEELVKVIALDSSSNRIKTSEPEAASKNETITSSITVTEEIQKDTVKPKTEVRELVKENSKEILAINVKTTEVEPASKNEIVQNTVTVADENHNDTVKPKTEISNHTVTLVTASEVPKADTARIPVPDVPKVVDNVPKTDTDARTTTLTMPLDAKTVTDSAAQATPVQAQPAPTTDAKNMVPSPVAKAAPITDIVRPSARPEPVAQIVALEQKPEPQPMMARTDSVATAISQPAPPPTPVIVQQPAKHGNRAFKEKKGVTISSMNTSLSPDDSTGKPSEVAQAATLINATPKTDPGIVNKETTKVTPVIAQTEPEAPKKSTEAQADPANNQNTLPAIPVPTNIASVQIASTSKPALASPAVPGKEEKAKGPDQPAPETTKGRKSASSTTGAAITENEKSKPVKPGTVIMTEHKAAPRTQPSSTTKALVYRVREYDAHEDAVVNAQTAPARKSGRTFQYKLHQSGKPSNTASTVQKPEGPNEGSTTNTKAKKEKRKKSLFRFITDHKGKKKNAKANG